MGKYIKCNRNYQYVKEHLEELARHVRDHNEEMMIKNEQNRYESIGEEISYLLKEVVRFRKTYDPIRKKMENLEDRLMALYGYVWSPVDPMTEHYDSSKKPHPGYPEGAFDFQMQAQDMASDIGYDPVTIKGYPPIEWCSSDG